MQENKCNSCTIKTIKDFFLLCNDDKNIEDKTCANCRRLISMVREMPDLSKEIQLYLERVN